VVTGHDERGRSDVLSDGPVPVVHEPTERPLQIPPGANGTVIRVTELEPGARSPMHRTETIDYGVVLAGGEYAPGLPPPPA
jgi:hypothetical protein